MAYTVNKLAKISGISVRTLHFYDEIGLLKPASIGDNNYRYYEEEQLLILQQILFYRELGFPLSEIKRIITSDDFNKITALNSHREILLKNLDQTKQLIKTIDKTILHLRGKAKMKENEFYYGFDAKKQKENEKFLIEKGYVTQEFLDTANKKIQNWSDKQKTDFLKDIDRILDALIKAMNDKLTPDNEIVQALIQEHFDWIKRTSWIPDKESYLGLADLYKTPEFRKFYDDRHPKLLEFLLKGMNFFAERKL